MQYQYALERIEDLLPLVSGEDPNEEKAVELSIYSDIVIEYEKEHFPIEKPTPAELFLASLTEKEMTQKDLARKMGRSEPAISRWTSGFPNLTLKSIAEISTALGEPLIKVTE